MGVLKSRSKNTSDPSSSSSQSNPKKSGNLNASKSGQKSVTFADTRSPSSPKSSVFLKIALVTGLFISIVGLATIAASYYPSVAFLAPLHTFAEMTAKIFMTNSFMIALYETGIGAALIIGSTACILEDRYAASSKA